MILEQLSVREKQIRFLLQYRLESCNKFIYVGVGAQARLRFEDPR
jgi:hypothetical protein